MQHDPRPEPAPMTDAEIAKLIPPKGKESFVHWYFMHIDLEPDWRTAMPSCRPRFSELSEKQFADLYAENLPANTARLENIDAGCRPRPNCLKRLRAGPIFLNGVFADALSARNGELSKL